MWEREISFELQATFFFFNVSLDDVSLQVSGDLTVTVHNVAPEFTSLTLDSTVIDENDTVTLTGVFDDPGTLDVHTVDIDWGDGTSSNSSNATDTSIDCDCAGDGDSACETSGRRSGRRRAPGEEGRKELTVKKKCFV